MKRYKREDILLVYSSRTGNTKKVAEAIAGALGIPALPVEAQPSPAGRGLVIAGFWVDRGTADAKMKAHLEHLQGKSVALFATLGADPASDHAAACRERATALLGAGCTVEGTFLCQGKVSEQVVAQMKTMFPPGHPHALTPEWMTRLAQASSHPDEEDLKRAQQYFLGFLAQDGAV